MNEERQQIPTWPSEARQRPCPICGGAAFTWGAFNPTTHPLRFKTNEDSWWVRNTAFGGEEVDARACDGCGNVQLFARR